jgi:hypothetical protein
MLMKVMYSSSWYTSSSEIIIEDELEADDTAASEFWGGHKDGLSPGNSAVVENVLRRFIGWPSRESLAGGRELLLSCIAKAMEESH